MSLPDRVYVDRDHTVPRGLVREAAKTWCKRCSGNGWYKFANGTQLFVCPCAQKRVKAKVTEALKAREEARKLPILDLLVTACGQMLGEGHEPVAIVVHPDIGAKITAATEVRRKANGIAYFQLRDKVLQMWVDPGAAEDTCQLFAEEDWKAIETEILREAAKVVLEAKAERDAKAELEKMRAETVAQQDQALQ